jgi:capsid protein
MIHRINDICDSEAIAWQMLARFAVAITRAEGAELAFDESKSDPNKSGDETEGDFATRLHELDYALLFHGEPGEEVKGIDRNIPGKDFSETLRMFLRLLGLPLGLPLELVLLDWTKSNYSQSRAVLEQAFEIFVLWQLLLENGLHRPAYEWMVRRATASGELGERDDAFRHEWIHPVFPWIDQLKEAHAYGVKLDRGLATHTQVLKSLNQDRDEMMAVREREIKDAIARADRIEEETGKKVPWQIFAGLKPPKPDAGRPGGDTPAAPADEKEEKE